MDRTPGRRGRPRLRLYCTTATRHQPKVIRKGADPAHPRPRGRQRRYAPVALRCCLPNRPAVTCFASGHRPGEAQKGGFEDSGVQIFLLPERAEYCRQCIAHEQTAKGGNRCWAEVGLRLAAVDQGRRLYVSWRRERTLIHPRIGCPLHLGTGRSTVAFWRQPCSACDAGRRMSVPAGCGLELTTLSGPPDEAEADARR